MKEEQSQAIVVREEENSIQKASIVLDSLPYVDAVHEDYEQYALSMIEDEMKTFAPKKMSALPFTKLRSGLLQNDFVTLSQNSDSLVDLQLSIRAKEPSENTIKEWRKSVKDARAEYEAERQRNSVLEVEKSEASAQQWKQYGTMLEALQKNTQKQLIEEKNAVERINAGRQQHQEKAGHSIHLLGSKWHGTLKKHFQLQIATRDLETQVESLRSQTPKTTENATAS